MNIFTKFFNRLFRREKQGSVSRAETSRLDNLRGVHKGRAAEQSKFSVELKKQRLNKPVHETYETGHKPGADPIVTDVSEFSNGEIARLLKTKSGNYYTGRVKTYLWEYNKTEYFLCLAEMIHINEDGFFVHAWQGPQPNVGYYNTRTLYVVIEGPEPKIKGINYEKNT
jgi:hypothetical protein